TVALATNALLLGTNEAARGAYLPGIAAGEITATLADLEPSAVTTTARQVDGGYVIDGAKRFVIDGHTASLLIIAARTGDDVALLAIPADTPGITRSLIPTMDMTRKLADVTLTNVRVPSSALIAEPGAGSRVLQKTLDRARVALAAEQVGGAQRCL